MPEFLSKIDDKIRLKLAFKTSLAVVLASLLAILLDFPHPYWSAITVFVLMTQNLESSLKKGIMRTFGTILGAIVGLIIASLFINDQVLLTISLFIMCGVAIHFYLLSPHGYSWMLGSATAFMVILAGAYDPNHILYIAIWRSAEVILGVIISAIMGKYIFPIHASQQLQNSINILSENNNYLFQLFVRHYLYGGSYEFEAANIKKKIRANIKKSKTLIPLAVKGNHNAAVQESFYLNFITKIEKIFSLLDHATVVLHRCNAINLDNAIKNKIKELVNIFSQQEKNIDFARVEQIFSELNNIEKKASNLEWLSFQVFIKELYDVFLALQESLPEPKKKRQSWRSYLIFDPVYVKHSIRVGIICVLTMYIWLYSGFHGGFVGIVSALIVSLERNLYSTVRKAILRLSGCVLGGITGLLFLPLVDDITTLIFIIFIGGFFFAFLNGGHQRYAYAGLQGGIAFVITLVAAQGPAVDVYAPLERLIGILIGVVTSIVVSQFLWPVSVTKELDKGLQKNIRWGRELFRSLLISKNTTQEHIAMLQKAINRQNINNEELVSCLFMDETRCNMVQTQRQLNLHISMLTKIKTLEKLKNEITENINEIYTAFTETKSLEKTIKNIENIMLSQNNKEMISLMIYLRQICYLLESKYSFLRRTNVNY